LKQQSEVTKN